MPEKAPAIERAGGLWPAIRRRVKRLFIAGPGRDRWQNPERVVAALGLQPGQRVADVGSGSGYFTLRLARAAAPDGRVYAVFGHVTGPGGLRVEMVQAGYRLVVEHDFLERDSFMIFEPS